MRFRGLFSIISILLFVSSVWADFGDPRPRSFDAESVNYSELVGKKGFRGANCYNAALRGSGGLPVGELRNVHQAEFELMLDLFYRPVSTFKKGDIVVFDANRARDHVAVMIGKKASDGTDLIFQTRGEASNFNFRILPITKAYDLDEAVSNGFEPTPSSPNAERTLSNVEYYRIRKDVRVDWSGVDVSVFHQVGLLNQIVRIVAELAPRWAVSKSLGYSGEVMLGHLYREFKTLKASSNFFVRLHMARFESARHQTFASIARESFASRFASAREDEIRKRIYIPKDLEVFLSLMDDLAEYYQVDFTSSVQADLLENLEMARESSRAMSRFSILEFFKQ